MIERLIYRSHAEGLPPEIALAKIFHVSVRKNTRLKITGALGFSGSSYIQLLEGPPPAIDGLLRTIQADTRHSQLKVLLRASAEGRLVPRWSMASIDLARATPKVETLLQADDGLGLTALFATLVHEGVAI
ncbi:hypothetical protein ABIC32_001380 [Brevundimonas sp. 1080]|uniref:BLUF domain-containing protein n=1 Tax=Brevundimonas sp. 1080 TaxID=3156405 RepID=UPI00339AA5E6